MTYYTILVTDSNGTYMLEDHRKSIILFINQTNAEKEACRVSTNYYVVQVVPYLPDSLDISYVVKDL